MRKRMFGKVAIVSLVSASLVVACSMEVTKTSDQSAELVFKVKEMLLKDTASSEDVAFIESLTPADFDVVFGALESELPPEPKSRNDVMNMEVEPADSWAGEFIECHSGSGGWLASSWMHTPLCGGDGGDHFFLHSGIPSAYSTRGYLQGQSWNPAVLLVLASYNWRLSARVYTSGNVYVCVGWRLHAVGLTEEVWRRLFYVYRVR